MQFRLLPALVVFCGSYLPLGLILLAQNFDYEALGTTLCWPTSGQSCQIPLRNPAVAFGFFLFTLICFIATLGVLALVKPTQDIVVIESKYIPADLMNYTLPYVVSFMSVDYQETGKFAGFLVFLGWMFWISLRSGQIILNPVLIAIGWRLYEVSYRFASSEEKQVGRSLVNGHLEVGPAKLWPVQDIQIMNQGG